MTVTEGPDELVVTVETALDRVGCASCGVRAEAQDRMAVAVRDLPCFGRPARLVWIKRRWRCVDPDCSAKTWTEASEHVDAQVVFTRRAGPRPADRWASWPGRWRRRRPSWACAS